MADPTSPDNGAWQYLSKASSTTLEGVAESVKLLPGRSLTAYDRDDPESTMQASVDFARRVAQVTVTDRTTGIRYILR